MNPELSRLLSLIGYAQEAMRSRNRVVADIADHGGFLLFERDISGLEGIKLSMGNMETPDQEWLRLEKPAAKESVPKPSSPLLAPWIKLGATTNDQPRLLDKILADSVASADMYPDQSENREGIDTIQGNSDWLVLDDYPMKSDLQQELSNYTRTTWASWAKREKNRRLMSRVYLGLFTLFQKLGGGLSEHQLELVWGGGLATYVEGNRRISYPAISQAMDLMFDEDSGSAVVRPRQLDPKFEWEMFIPGEIPQISKEDLDQSENLGLTSSFNPFDKSSYSDALNFFKKVVLNSNPAATLEFEESWVLFSRPRSSSLAVQDLERFRSSLQRHMDGESLPPAVRSLLVPPSDRVLSRKSKLYRGVSFSHHETERGGEVSDLFFPKPFNTEQARVASLLEESDGVVVQGPPGTGKTHTIANIICHWLATGRRVLVSSMREPALAVLREMLPQEIRPLVISLLSTEQDGLEQFVESIEQIAYGVQSLDPDAVRLEVKGLEEQIEALHRKISGVDDEVNQWAKLNLSQITIDEETLYPQEAAQEVVRSKEAYQSIPDPLGVSSNYRPTFDDNDISQLKERLKELGDDILFINDSLPSVQELPDSISLTKAHGDLQRFRRLTDKARKTDWPWPDNADARTLESARILAQEVRQVSSRWGHLLGARLPWSEVVVKRIRSGEPADIFSTLDDLGRDLEKLSIERTAFLKRPVRVPDSALLDPLFLSAVKRLSEGKKAYTITTPGKGVIKNWLSLTKVGGVSPHVKEDWLHVYAYADVFRRREELTARWNELAPEIGLHAVLSIDTKGQLSAEGQFAFYKAIRELAEEQKKLAKKSTDIFPDWAKASNLVVNPAVIDELSYALEYHLSRHGLSTVSNIMARLKNIVERSSGKFSTAIAHFLSDKLGNPEVEGSLILKEWDSLVFEIERVNSKKSALKDVHSIIRKIRESGAVELSKLLLNPSNDSEGLIEALNLKNWRLRRLATHIFLIDSQEKIKALFSLRAELEGDLTTAYERILIRRTWQRLAKTVTPSVRASLQVYLNAIQRIGKGTGKKAIRFRQEARNAALEAQKAIPCWVMPHHRVSEALPAEIGCFDLVIIDEASQSDLSALPVMLRGSKMLIVGDDRQVTPQAIGFQEDRIKDLMNRALLDQVPAFKDQLAPDRSIYDLARVVFANNGVMLKEHFRCVAPIIEYSKREFYKHELQPLRLPLASESIYPPLLDVLVTSGRREKSINSQEVEFIVEDISRLCSDRRFEGRSIGVISMLGEDQANQVWDRLLEVVGIGKLRSHNVVCGDARMFQGREKDIVYLSLVVAPNDLGAPLTGDVFAQRFNVATSRARDQMILVRSVQESDLALGDSLRRSLIAHFSKPFEKNIDAPDVSRRKSLCESSLEREIYDWLESKGYRFRPKVDVGIYRVDFVVEGKSDKRLAIECDGDKYQESDSWVHSMQRQRVLERTGWVFWRCFASSFVLEPEKVLADLEASLSANGIYSISSDDQNASLTETREVSMASSRTDNYANVHKLKPRAQLN